MKTTNKLLALVIMAVAMVFASCSKDDNNDGLSQQEIEKKIVGKWKNTFRDGQPILTNNREILTYCSDKTANISISRVVEDLDVFVWDNKVPYTWNVEGNIVSEKSVNPGVTMFRNAIEIDDNHISYTLTKIIDPQGKEHIRNWNVVAQKVTADYSHDIIGLWEGVSLTGEETYGNAEARIEYYADGTYTYFQKHAGIWCASEDVDNEYNVDGDWLATRWRPEEGAEYNYEWWDIDYIKDGEMKWSALRENRKGERYTTTFIWKKIESPSTEQYRSMILGDWKNIQADFYFLKDGEMKEFASYPTEFDQTMTFGSDGSYSIRNWTEDGTLIDGYYGHYEMKGSIVTVYFERYVSEEETEEFTEPVADKLKIHEVDDKNLSLLYYTVSHEESYDHEVYNLKLRRP